MILYHFDGEFRRTVRGRHTYAQADTTVLAADPDHISIKRALHVDVIIVNVLPSQNSNGQHSAKLRDKS